MNKTHPTPLEKLTAFLAEEYDTTISDPDIIEMAKDNLESWIGGEK